MEQEFDVEIKEVLSRVQKIKKILDKFMKTCPSFVHNLGMFFKG